MQSYLGGQDITVTIPLVVSDGCVSTQIEGDTVEYRVIDQSETVLVAKTSLTSYVSGDTSAVVTVLAASNSLGSDVRGLRVIELYVTDINGAKWRISHEYILEAEFVLVVGANSFQTYPAALMLGYELPNMAGWNAASKIDRINAMLAAYRNFSKVALRYIESPIGGIDMTRVVVPGQGEYDATRLDATQFGSLPTEMRDAIMRAQLYEADYLLGGDVAGDIRRSGVMSSTVGESSQFFRTSKPYEGPLCKRALSELSRYLARSVRTGRA